MNKAKAIAFSFIALISAQVHAACSPSISESKAGGNIVITNNCGLSDEAVLEKLEKFKTEQIKSSKDQNRNQREIIRQFNKNQQETAAKLDEILNKVQDLGVTTTQEANSTANKNINSPQASSEERSRTNEDTLAIAEQNYRTILESIKTRRLVFQEEIVARLLINQDIPLDCVKISELIAEARNQNRYITISTSFIELISTLAVYPLSPTCFQDLNKNLDPTSADRIISIIKSTKTSNKKTEPSATPIAKAPDAARTDVKTNGTKDTPPAKIRQIVSSFTSALGNESGGYRVEAIRLSIESLPNNLTADEIRSISGKETGGYKQSILDILSAKIQKNSLDPGRVSNILQPDGGGYRYEQLRILAPYIKPPIDANDMVSILSGLYSSQRSDAINLLAEKIKTPIDEESIKLILGDLSGDARRTAIKSLITMQARSLESEPKTASSRKPGK